jgi:glycosyltransferase involved in cell wall biosynthesis
MVVSMRPPRVIFATNVLPVTGFTGWQNVNCSLLNYLVANGVFVHVCCFLRSTAVIPSDYALSENGKNWSTSLTGYYGELGTPNFRQMFYFRVRGFAARILRRIAGELPRGLGHNVLMRASRVLSSIFDQRWTASPDRWDHRHFRSAIAAYKPDCVIIDYAFLASLLVPRSAAVRPLQMILTHDLLHQRWTSLRAVMEWDHFKPLSAAEEARFLADADVLVIERDDQLEEFRRLAPSAKLVVAQWAVSPRAVNEPEVKGQCLFVGAAASHNIVGLRWFLERVWPLIISKHPAASLTVCGDICDAFTQEDRLRQTGRVDWRGRVDDLSEYYRDAEVCILPYIGGSGFKTKLIEAMAYGRAVVSTTEGAAGLALNDPPIVLIADEPERFADTVTMVLGDVELRSALGRRAVTYVQRHLGPDTLYRPILELIRGSVDSGPEAQIRN